MPMPVQIKFSLVLTSVCLVAMVCVAGMYTAAKPNIERSKIKSTEDALLRVLPDAKYYIQIQGENAAGKLVTFYYIGLKELPEGKREGQVIKETRSYAPIGPIAGYAALADAQGYSSKPEVMIGVDAGLLAITRLTVTFQKETPGLGARAEETQATKSWFSWIGLESIEEIEHPEIPWFQKLFSGKTYDQLYVTKSASDANGIRAISGATITSAAITEAAKKAWNNLKADLIQDGRLKQ